jgi:exosortase/archaeosortase family protein
MDNYTKRLIIRMLSLIFILVFSKDIIYPILKFLTIKLSYIFLLPLRPTIQNASTFIIKGQVIEIVPACVALSAYILFSILILSTKDLRLIKTLKFLIYGSLAILIINIIRIDVLIYALIFMGSRLFEPVHLLFWKVLSGVVVVVIWIYLTRKYNITEIPIYSDVKYLINKIKSKG